MNCRSLRRFFVCAVMGAFSAASAMASGQVPLPRMPRAVPQVDRVTATASPQMMAITGHLPVWINQTNLLAAPLDATEPMNLVVVLRRAPSAEQAFKDFLAAQQTPGSPLYHQALSPAQQGLLYGPTQHDIDAVMQWASAQGLVVGALSPSRTQLRLTGSVASVASAFRVHFSMYNTVHGPRRGPDTEPMLPAALAPVVEAIVGLTPENLYPQNAGRDSTPMQSAASAEEGQSAQWIPRPLFTGGKGSHFITPADFAAIYDVTPTYTANNTGATIGSVAQHVAIVADSTANPADIQAFFAGIGTAQPSFNVVLADATPPAATVSQREAELDLERVLGTAPGVMVDLVEGSGSTPLFDSASYAVNTLQDPIITMSFGFCEPSLGAAGAKMWSDLWMTAAGNMTSVFVSGGDAGAAACDSHDAAPPTMPTARAINGVASTPYDTAVGGTEFADAGNPTQYWSATNNPTTKQSATGYIPEGAWNDPTMTDPTTGNVTPSVNAGGGGASMYNPKPSWQVGTGVPADQARDTPDISFSGSYFHDVYYYCGPGECTTANQSNPATFVAFGDGGTSATAPTMAGIAALLNTAAGARQGLLNPTIYRLANSAVAGQIFHDVTVASSGVANCDLAVPSLCNNSVASSASAATAGTTGFMVGTGYDQATGWGSLDVANFIRAAVPVSTTLQITTTGTAVSTSQTLTASVSLTASAASLAPPSGTVQFLVNGTASGAPVALSGTTATSAALVFSTAGSYVITAMYSGDALYVPSTSAAVTVFSAAMAPGLSLTPASMAVTFPSGATSGNSVAVAVAGTNNYAGTVALSCAITTSTAAFQPTCSVSPTSTTLQANGTAMVNVSIASTTAQAEMRLPAHGAGAGKGGMRFAGVSFAVLFGLFGASGLRKGRRRSALPRLVCALMLWGGATSLTGCAGGNSAPKRSSAGTYTVTVTGQGMGTGALNASTATTSFTVTIQ